MKRIMNATALAGFLVLAMFAANGCGGGGKSLDKTLAPTDETDGIVQPFVNEDPEDLPDNTDEEVGPGDITPNVAFSGGATVADSGAEYIGREACVTCHELNSDTFGGTAHGLTWDANTTTPTAPESHFGETAAYGLKYCVQCHTVAAPFTDLDEDHTFDPADGEIGAFGLSPSTTAGVWGGAGGVAVYTDYTEVPDGFGGVQCENCHGPGSLHSGDPDFIVQGQDAMNVQTCNFCHQQAEEWIKSPHSLTSQGGEGTTSVGSKSCTPCHTGEGFAAYSDYAKTSDEDIVTFAYDVNALIKSDGTAVHNLGCASCHDPHEKRNDNQLRLPPEELCITCHEGRKKVPGDSHAPHHNLQGRVLNGHEIINPDGKMLWSAAVLLCGNHEYSATADVAATCGTKNSILTAATSFSPTMGEETSCVDCHMYAYTDRAAGIDWKGHTFKPRTEACQKCHEGMDAANVIGQKQANFLVQQEALEARYALAEAASAGFNAQQAKYLLWARWNLDTVDYDGSKGMHNTPLVNAAFEYTDGFLKALGY